MKIISENKKAYKIFISYIGISITVVIFLIFSFLFYRNYKLYSQQELDRARSNFDSIVITRAWNAKHGGVFVEKTEGMKSNPYLKNPDIYTSDGKTYTKKNPALMTREISEMANKTDMYRFHITSLNPLNPNNIPDKFERNSLELFEKDRNIKEQILKEQDKKGNWIYRYIAPLITKKSCLKCHGHQGYEEGDIRGGISVSFNINENESSYLNNMIWLTIFFIIIILSTLYFVYYFSTQLFRKLQTYEEKLLKIEQENAIHAMSVTANHEINQPLTVISGYLEIIKITGTDNLNNKQIKALNNMSKSIVIIANILQKYKNSNKSALRKYAKGISMVKFDESIDDD